VRLRKSLVLFIDCLKVHQAGFTLCRGFDGLLSFSSEEQLLRDHFQEAVLFLHGDKDGRAAGGAIAVRLVSKLSTRLVEIPAGSQPDQLGPDQIRCLCIPGYFLTARCSITIPRRQGALQRWFYRGELCSPLKGKQARRPRLSRDDDAVARVASASAQWPAHLPRCRQWIFKVSAPSGG
jgi:hypothetical protein